jgi:hypothetical protein
LPPSLDASCNGAHKRSIPRPWRGSIDLAQPGPRQRDERPLPSWRVPGQRPAHSQSIQSADQCARGCLPAPQTGLIRLFFVRAPARVHRLDALLKGRARGALLPRGRPDGLLALRSIGHRVSSPRWLSKGHPLQKTQGWKGTCAGLQDQVIGYRVRLCDGPTRCSHPAIRGASPRDTQLVDAW